MGCNSSHDAVPRSAVPPPVATTSNAVVRARPDARAATPAAADVLSTTATTFLGAREDVVPSDERVILVGKSVALMLSSTFDLLWSVALIADCTEQKNENRISILQTTGSLLAVLDSCFPVSGAPPTSALSNVHAILGGHIIDWNDAQGHELGEIPEDETARAHLAQLDLLVNQLRETCAAATSVLLLSPNVVPSASETAWRRSSLERVGIRRPTVESVCMELMTNVATLVNVYFRECALPPVRVVPAGPSLFFIPLYELDGPLPPNTLSRNAPETIADVAQRLVELARRSSVV